MWFWFTWQNFYFTKLTIKKDMVSILWFCSVHWNLPVVYFSTVTKRVWKNWKVSARKLILSSLTISTTLQLTKLKKRGGIIFKLLTEIIWNSISLKFHSLFSTVLLKELYLILAKRIILCKPFHSMISPLKTVKASYYLSYQILSLLTGIYNMIYYIFFLFSSLKEGEGKITLLLILL